MIKRIFGFLLCLFLGLAVLTSSALVRAEGDVEGRDGEMAAYPQGEASYEVLWPEEYLLIDPDLDVFLGTLNVSGIEGVREIALQTPFTELVDDAGEAFPVKLKLVFGDDDSEVYMKQDGTTESGGGSPMLYANIPGLPQTNRLPVMAYFETHALILNVARAGTCYRGWITYKLTIIDEEGNRTEEFLTQWVEMMIPVPINSVFFPDASFREIVAGELIDLDQDGYLNTQEIAAVWELNVASQNIYSLKGIEFFNALRHLNCDDNHLEALDLSKNTRLKELFCDNNGLTSLDLSANPALEVLDCDNNKLTSLDLSANPRLRYLFCEGNQLASLGLSGNPELVELYCGKSPLKSLDVTKCGKLAELHCEATQLSSLDLSGNPALVGLFCNGAMLKTLDVSKNTELYYLNAAETPLASLDLSKNVTLEWVNLRNNTELASVKLPAGESLIELYTYGCPKLALLDIFRCERLMKVYREGECTITSEYKEYAHGLWGALRVDPWTKVVSYETGWVKQDGKWFYYDEDGAKAVGWQKISGKWYYFEDSGAMVTGWQKISGKWYYFEGSGAMVTGWKQISGKWYYFAGGGAMVTGWQKINEKWYYFAGGGAMVTGWQKINEKWYYFAGGGAMVTGWQTINKKTYFFKSSGVMAANEWVTGYWWLNADGTWTYKYKGSWNKNSKGWWFGDTSGWYAKNTTIRINEKEYCFDANGYLK